MKHVLCYLKGTRGRQPTLGGKLPNIAAYMDTDWGSNCDDRHSIGAYIIKIDTGAVSWKSKKQSCVALSSTEAEYMALFQVAKEAMWMTDFFRSTGVQYTM